MARRKILTDEQITKLPPRTSAYPDPELAGHYIRVRPTGKRVFCVVARDPRGKQVWHTIGGTDLFNVAEAREAAREVIKAIKTGGNRDGAETFESVAGQWIKRHVEAKGLISAPDIKSYLSRVLIPAWGGREFVSIKRSDVAKLLDEVEDESGLIAADYVLSIVRGICNWYATRHDDYSSPGRERHAALEPESASSCSYSRRRRITCPVGGSRGERRLWCFRPRCAADGPEARENRRHELEGHCRWRVAHTCIRSREEHCWIAGAFAGGA